MRPNVCEGVLKEFYGISEAEFSRYSKVNLGAGNQGIEGWINIDARNLRGVNHIMEAYPITKFPPESFDLVFSSHLIEHFEHFKIRGVLKNWISLIRPGKYLVICTGDLDWQYAALMGEKTARPQPIKYKDRVVDWNFFNQGVFAGWSKEVGQNFDSAYDVHKCIFNEYWMRKFLEDLGVGKIKRFYKSEAWNLNLVGVKK